MKSRHPHTPVLTPEIVHHIRTCGLSDDELAKLYDVSWTSINHARRGYTWANHPTPPDRRPRLDGGHKFKPRDLSAAPSMDGLLVYDAILYDRLRIKCRLDDDGCWIWMGAVSGSKHRPSGHHGTTTVNGRHTSTHRAMWRAVNGNIPEGMHVCHQCDKPLCLRPDHLWLGSHTDNMRDSMAKGRHVNVRGRHA